MSTKRKKNSRSPRRPEVSFLRIYEAEENPWPQDYYMCGMCGHAIAAKDTVRHAKNNHNASAIKLLEIDDTPLTEEEVKEQQALGLLPYGRDGDSDSERTTRVVGGSAEVQNTGAATGDLGARAEG